MVRLRDSRPFSLSPAPTVGNPCRPLQPESVSFGVFGIQALAFAGGLLAVTAVYMIGSAPRGGDTILVLVLTGVVVGSLLGSGVGLVKYLADPYNQLPAMTFWLLGSLAGTSA